MQSPSINASTTADKVSSTGGSDIVKYAKIISVILNFVLFIRIILTYLKLKANMLLKLHWRYFLKSNL